MDYNTTRPPLVFREYGRNIQKLINHIASIKDKKERTKKAKALVETLAQMESRQKDSEEFRHKLWDHVFIMSDFDLDVDAPFPKPKDGPVSISKASSSMPYPQQKITYRHYGKNVELYLQKINEIKDRKQRKRLINMIADYMKMAYKKWSSDNISDDHIWSDLKKLSGNKVDVKKKRRKRKSRKKKRRKRKKRKKSKKKGNSGKNKKS